MEVIPARTRIGLSFTQIRASALRREERQTHAALCARGFRLMSRRAAPNATKFRQIFHDMMSQIDGRRSPHSNSLSRSSAMLEITRSKTENGETKKKTHRIQFCVLFSFVSYCLLFASVMFSHILNSESVHLCLGHMQSSAVRFRSLISAANALLHASSHRSFRRMQSAGPIGAENGPAKQSAPKVPMTNRRHAIIRWKSGLLPRTGAPSTSPGRDTDRASTCTDAMADKVSCVAKLFRAAED